MAGCKEIALSSKSDLRRRMRAHRQALAASNGDAAERAAAAAPSSLFASVAFVASYLPMGSEIDPGPLARRFAETGATLLAPVVAARGAPLIFREAGPVAAERDPQVIIVPLLAFDAGGWRIGYGGGYFDRTLAALRARTAVLAVGLAFAGQEVDSVPHEAHDQKLDAVLTELGYRSFSQDGA